MIDTENYVMENLLKMQYHPSGVEIKLPTKTQFYVSGWVKCKRGLIIIPDALGWKSGRIRHLSDYFGVCELLTVVPNFNSRGVEGETVGLFESNNLMDWHKSKVFDGNIKPIIKDILDFMHENGIEKVALMGVAWGSWAVASLLASDIAEEFYCGALVQPSLDLEDQRYGGSAVELVSRIKRPVLLLPVMGDPQFYTHLIRLLKYKIPSSQVIDYHHMEAGFLLHGLVFDQRVANACRKIITDIYTFLQQHFQMNEVDFVVSEEPLQLGPEAEFKRVGDKLGPAVKRGVEKIRNVFEKTSKKLKLSLKGDSCQEDIY